VNTAFYLSMMDLGPRRPSCALGACGKRLTECGFTGRRSQTIKYRKSCSGQRVRARDADGGIPRQGLFVEQAFVVDGRMYARAC